MENQNLNFAQLVNCLSEVAQQLQQMKLEREFLEKEIKELREEIESNNKFDRGILKPEEAKELITNFFLEGFDKDGLVTECEEAVTIESEDYGGYLRIEKNVSIYDIESKVDREIKGLLQEFFREFKDRILILDIKEEEVWRVEEI